MAKKPKDDDKPAKYEIDILEHELETGAPHWLSPAGKRGTETDEERKKQIRDKHYRKHLATRARAKAEATLARTKPK
jgi:hypothetical protein